MYVHACMTHPAVFVFGSVIKGVVPGRALPCKCSVRKNSQETISIYVVNAHSDSGDSR